MTGKQDDADQVTAMFKALRDALDRFPGKVAKTPRQIALAATLYAAYATLDDCAGDVAASRKMLQLMADEAFSDLEAASI